METSRRTFLKTSVGTLAACCGFGGISTLSSCTTPRMIGFETKQNSLLVNPLDFGEDKFVLLQADQLPAPLYLRKFSDKKYGAYLMLCTHKGCDVKPAGNIMVCPCHGSEFSGAGQVLKGPATEDLISYPTTLQNGKIEIQIPT